MTNGSNAATFRTTDSGVIFGIHSQNSGDIYIKDTSDNVLFYGKNGGNVGIGTTSPSTKLTIAISNASHSNEGILLTSSGGYGEGAIYHDYGQGNGLTAFKIRNLYGGSEINLSQDSYSSSGSPSSIMFSTSAASNNNTPTERMRISSEGYVYINATSNPLPDNAQPQFALTGGSGTDAVAIKHTQNANNTLNIWQTGTTQHNAIAFYKGDTQTNRGNIVVTTSGTSYNTVSDYRLKENITPLENGLDRLMQLKPSKFNWIENGEETEGFIAHELQEYFPYAVSGEKDAVYLSTGNIKAQSVDYGRITPLLVKALQELKEEFDQYKLTHP